MLVVDFLGLEALMFTWLYELPESQFYFFSPSSRAEEVFQVKHLHDDSTQGSILGLKE